MAATTQRDYYAVLGVPRTAGAKDIKAAYRRLARKHHPDVNPGDKKAEATFKEIGEAYSVLSDAAKRKKYDRWGKDWEKIEQAHAAGRGNVGGPAGQRVYTSTNGAPGSFSFDFEGEDTGSLFEQLFGGAGGRARKRAAHSRRGEDIEQPVNITLEEAVLGTERGFQVQDASTGALKTIQVKIPAGAYDGLRIRVAGKGQPGVNGGPAGDVYLVVTILPHPEFERDGQNLRVLVPTPLYTAILGGEVLVPTPKGGRLALKVQPETQNGQRIRLAGQGLVQVGRPDKGDLYAEITVQLPRNLTDRERALFKELAEQRSSTSGG